MHREVILRVRGLTAGYVPDVNILEGVDVDVHAGEIVSIIGPNGAGKSTLVKSIVGIAPPRRGDVLLRGEAITRKRPHAIVRKGLGYVPQRANVFATMTVEENLQLGCLSRPAVDAEAALESVYEVLPRLAERRRQRAGTLSGGERQMLAMGRALMAEPTVLLLDEPSAALSPLLVDIVFDKIVEINADGTAILLVEQNARRALAISHRGYVLELGRNRFEGRGEDLLNDPKVTELYLGGAGRIDSNDDGNVPV